MTKVGNYEDLSKSLKSFSDSIFKKLSKDDMFD